MVTQSKWKESVERKVTLKESPLGITIFHILIELFSILGSSHLTIANVCGIHTLAEKVLCFINDVLTGVHGDSLKAGLEWPQYVESFVPGICCLLATVL